MALFAVLMCVNFASCSGSSDDSDIEPNEPQKPKEYMVSLGLTGEINVSESPLSRVSGNDLYGIQVYSCPNIEGNTDYTPYAYGLFDNTSLMNIKLLEGYKYNFKATMVVDGKENIYSSDGRFFVSPFAVVADHTELSNDFTYSNNKYMPLSNGYAKFKFNDRYLTADYAIIDRYYGEVEDYIPSEGNTVEINMKRTVFGVKFIAENLTEGSIGIKMSSAPQMSIIYPNTEINYIINFANQTKAYSEENHSATLSTVLAWTKSDGVVVPLGTHDITFKRNKLTTVTIKVADITTENGFGITIDDEEKEMGEGDNLTVENGEITDTTIGTETETEG